MPRLIGVFAGRTLILLVLSCRGASGFISNSHVAVASYYVKRLARSVQEIAQTTTLDSEHVAVVALDMKFVAQ